MDTLRVGVAQFDQSFEDKPGNRSRIEALLDAAPPTDLCVLPEMTLTGFSMDPARTALDEDDHAFFADLARRKGTAIAYGGVVDARNVAILVDREGRRSRPHAKTHLFGLGSEPRHYVAGDSRTVWDLDGWRILPAICYDLRFSYLFWEGAAEIDLVVVPANWPASRREHWRALLLARAIENQVPVAGCNRIGSDPALRYAGDSMLLDAQGRILSDAADVEGVAVAELSRRSTSETRARFPFLADRLR